MDAKDYMACAQRIRINIRGKLRLRGECQRGLRLPVNGRRERARGVSSNPLTLLE